MLCDFFLESGETIHEDIFPFGVAIDLSYLHFVIHGVFKCLMFLLAGAFIHTIYNEQDIRKYGALAFVNSFLSLSFFLSNILIVKSKY